MLEDKPGLATQHIAVQGPVIAWLLRSGYDPAVGPDHDAVPDKGERVGHDSHSEFGRAVRLGIPDRFRESSFGVSFQERCVCGTRVDLPLTAPGNIVSLRMACISP